MMSPQEILKELHKLPQTEQKEVFDALAQQFVENTDDDDDQKLQKRLFEKGMIREIKPPYRKRLGDFPAIKLEGSPVSDLIIEERR